MQDKVEINLQVQDDSECAEDLIEFFEPVANSQLIRDDNSFLKSWTDTVHTLLTLAGGWAAKRYVLDVLAG